MHGTYLCAYPNIVSYILIYLIYFGIAVIKLVGHGVVFVDILATFDLR